MLRISDYILCILFALILGSFISVEFNIPAFSLLIWIITSIILIYLLKLKRKHDIKLEAKEQVMYEKYYNEEKEKDS